MTIETIQIPKEKLMELFIGEDNYKWSANTTWVYKWL